MELIATWSFEPWLKRVGTHWEKPEHMLLAAKAALDHAHKQYGRRTTVYTDTLGAEIFSELSPHALCLPIYDDIFEGVNPKLWAFAKLNTYALQKQPYMHYDLDFIWLKPMTVRQMASDLVVHGFESLQEGNQKEKMAYYYNLPKLGHLYKLPAVMQHDNPNAIPAMNTGCLFMNNMDLNAEYVETMFSLIDNNLDLFNSDKALDMCVVEQHSLGMIIHNNPSYKSETVFADTKYDGPPVNDQAIHFVGSNYKTSKYPAVVDLQNKLFEPYRDYTVERVMERLLALRQ